MLIISNQSYNYGFNLQELELDKFVTDKVSFADINKAFDHMLKGEGLRTVIKVIQDQ